jgi:hypothetical protein
MSFALDISSVFIGIVQKDYDGLNRFLLTAKSSRRQYKPVRTRLGDASCR